MKVSVGAGSIVLHNHKYYKEYNTVSFTNGFEVLYYGYSHLQYNNLRLYNNINYIKWSIDSVMNLFIQSSIKIDKIRPGMHGLSTVNRVGSHRFRIHRFCPRVSWEVNIGILVGSITVRRRTTRNQSQLMWPAWHNKGKSARSWQNVCCKLGEAYVQQWLMSLQISNW